MQSCSCSVGNHTWCPAMSCTACRKALVHGGCRGSLACTQPPHQIQSRRCASPLCRDRYFGGNSEKTGERAKKARGDSDWPAGERSGKIRCCVLVLLWVLSPLQYVVMRKKPHFEFLLCKLDPIKWKARQFGGWRGEGLILMPVAVTSQEKLLQQQV